MTFENDLIIKIINNFCSKWTKKYNFFTKLLNENLNEKIFLTEFSELLKEETVPLVSVKVYFKAIIMENDNFIITFKFEKDELIHDFNNTINIKMMEKWLERYFENKNLTKNKFLWATEFERTRINEPRFKNLEKKQIIKEKIYEVNEIDEELRQPICEIEYKVNKQIEDSNYNMVKKLSYMIFRLFDPSDTGIISNEKFKQILYILNLDLNEKQFLILKEKNHLDNNGFLYSEQCIPIIVNILLGIIYFHHSLNLKDYQNNLYNHIGSLMLIFDERKNHFDEIIDDLIEKEEESKNPISKEVFDSIFYSFSEFFNEEEKTIINETVYKELYDKDNNIVKYKLLKQKTMEKFSYKIGKDIEEMERNELERYLISQLGQNKELDESELFEKLGDFKRIKLSTIQKLIIVKKFPKLNYKKFNVNFHTFYLEKYINYLFDPMNQFRLKELEKTANYKREEKIDLYSNNKLYNQLIKTFKKFDKDNDNFWNFDEFSDFFKSLKYLNFNNDLIWTTFSIFDEFKEKLISKKDFTNLGFEILKYKITNKMFDELLKNYIITF